MVAFVPAMKRRLISALMPSMSAITAPSVHVKDLLDEAEYVLFYPPLIEVCDSL
jgi:hypothetical protein